MQRLNSFLRRQFRLAFRWQSSLSPLFMFSIILFFSSGPFVLSRFFKDLTQIEVISLLYPSLIILQLSGWFGFLCDTKELKGPVHLNSDVPSDKGI